MSLPLRVYVCVCVLLTWHKNAKIIYLPCLQFSGTVLGPRLFGHVDTGPIRQQLPLLLVKKGGVGRCNSRPPHLRRGVSW